MCTCPHLSAHSPEEEQHSLGEGLEVVVPVDLCRVIQGDFPEHLAGGEDGVRELWTEGSWFPPIVQWSLQGSQLTLDGLAHKLNRVPSATWKASRGQVPAALSSP